MCWLKILCVTASVTSGVIEGPATVQDGDTIYVNHQAIRLFGVDAEELSEPNGIRAKLALRALIGEADVRCVLSGERSYSRLIARCYIGTAELNQSIIAAGWALDCRRYSGGIYRKDEPAGARAKLIQKPYC
jgi:micrococcal nuclease